MSVIVCGGILQSVSERREKEGRDGELKIKREKKRKKKAKTFEIQLVV